MDPLTLLSLGQTIYGGVQNFQAAKEDKAKAKQATANAEAAKLAGEATYQDLKNSTRYRTAQAPTGAADLSLNLAQQGLDFNRDQAQAAQAQSIAGLRDDPRNVGSLLRTLNQINTGIQGAEQRAGQQAITSQKIIDDSIYNQQETERKRLAGLTEQYELLPAMQEYTQQTGLADSLAERANAREAQTLQDAMGITTTLAGMSARNKTNQPNTTDTSTDTSTDVGLDEYRRRFNDFNLQNELAQPIPIDLPSGQVDRMDMSGLEAISLGQEQPLQEDLDLRTSRQLLNRLDNYEPDTAPFGVPFTNAVNPYALSPDPVDSLLQGSPQQNADIYRPAPTAAPSSLNSITPTSVTDPYGLEGRQAAYQGSGPDSVYSPLLPLDQQVFGGMQGYNSLANPFAGYEDGGYIGERGGMTTGEFNHDTNKKAIIDEVTGEKEGEITGGEAVFNDQHLADIVEMVKEGDEDGLLTYLRNLLEEPQFGYEFA